MKVVDIYGRESDSHNRTLNVRTGKLIYQYQNVSTIQLYNSIAVVVFSSQDRMKFVDPHLKTTRFDATRIYDPLNQFEGKVKVYARV